jgi:hypothetical protein
MLAKLLMTTLLLLGVASTGGCAALVEGAVEGMIETALEVDDEAVDDHEHFPGCRCSRGRAFHADDGC